MTLEAFLGSWTVDFECFVYARCYFSKCSFYHDWVDFFMILGGFGLVWGDILGAKERPKLLHNLSKKMIDFWIAPKTALGGLWGSKRGPRGEGQNRHFTRGGGPFSSLRGETLENN